MHVPPIRAHRHFGLDHVATAWLGQALEGASHDAVGDAAKSMRVYLHYLELRKAANASERLAAAQQLLLTTPKAPSFALQVCG